MRTSLFYGAVILFAANLFNRILGFGYQYFIMRYIGSESYGLFCMVFPVYMTALVLTTAGLPLAVAKMVAEKASLGHYREVQKIFRLALLILFLSGLMVSLVLYGNISNIVGRFFSDKRVLIVFRICLPAIFIVSVASAFRGYFQGLQNMLPSALSQSCEQIVRIAVGFTLAVKLLPRGVEWGAAGLAAGMLCGEFIGLMVISAQYFKQKKALSPSHPQGQETTRRVLRRLFSLSLPVTGGRLLASGLSALDAVIIPKQLQAAGHAARSATSLFGQLSGTALTLLSFPSVFTFALATSLVPAIAEAMAKKDYALARNRCLDSLKYTMILGLPCVLCLYLQAEPLARLFRSGEVAPALKILALGGIFSYLQQTTTGILQGLGKTFLPFAHSAAGALLRLPLLYYLTGNPEWGLSGSALAYIIGFFSVAILNLLAIRRHLGLPLELRSFVLQPFSAGLAMFVTIKGLALFLRGPIAMPASLTAGVLLYFSILLLNGGINPREIKKIPLISKFLP